MLVVFINYLKWHLFATFAANHTTKAHDKMWCAATGIVGSKHANRASDNTFLVPRKTPIA
jgi:uncharacterized protein YfaT (DUF1175 family)